jgi:pyruvate-formate lyase-activating enzyme
MDSIDFHVLAKPIGPTCNLDCKYCFYLEKESLYPQVSKWAMCEDVLDSYIRQYIEGHDTPVVNFAWQGGEPTLLGVNYFRNVFAIQKRYASGRRIQNAFQTNGVLLNDEWAALFRESDFLIGLSIDGPRELHDTYRVDKGGQPTFDRVMRGLETLQRNAGEFNTLTTVHRGNADHPLEVYRFLKDCGRGFMQFIPMVERIAHQVTSDGLQLISRSYLNAPFPQFTAVDFWFLGGEYERYNSFQSKVNKRLSRGLTTLISFTGQKQIDDYSIISNVGNNAGGIQNIYNPRAESAVSSNDISRNLVINGVYSLPVGRGQRFGAHWNKPADILRGGWQVNGIATEQTGFPLPVSTQNTSQSGSNVLRPNLTGVSPVVGGSGKSGLSNYMNAAAFSQPAAFTFGNAPRTLSNVRAEGTHNIDFSMFKKFQAAERANIEFRAEAFNILNQVVFGNRNTVLTSGQFGKITSQANTPREIQLALKVLFWCYEVQPADRLTRGV